jgi:hypothetical protein
MWPLTALPAELAGGVDDANFKKRLTGTTWTIEKEPTKESVKNGRFNVTIELIYELTFESIYGPRNPLLDLGANPVLLNLSNVLSIAGLPIALDKSVRRSAALALSLNLPAEVLSVAGTPTALSPLTYQRNAGVVASLALGSELTVAAASPARA